MLSFFPFFIIWGMVFICAELYPEPYLFFEYFISDLGVSTTPNGYDNTLCMYIFIVAFVMLGTVFIFMAYLFYIDCKYRYYYLLTLLCLTTSIGCFYITFPRDMFVIDAMHGIGAITFYISFGLLIIVMNENNIISYIIGFCLILILVLSFVDNSLIFIFQKLYMMLLTTAFIFTSFTRCDNLKIEDDTCMLKEPIF